MPRSWNLWKSLLIVFALWAPELWAADFSLNNTCQNCTRRYNDSINVYARRAIRVNQVGFRPQDPKDAFVSNPKATTFKVINALTGGEAFSGVLESLGSFPRPGIWVNGAFNSINSIYQFGDTTTAASTENLYKASFSELTTPGQYYIKVGTDTSAWFRINDKIYNYIFESALQFFGSQRCGNTNSWMHAACHLKDGSAVGHDLTGGWHDCGDHFKVAATVGYAALIMAVTYTIFPEKAEDFYGKSYNDTLPFGTDGIPDLLWETKVGADYIFKLYKASKADGLIAKGDMYHSVGVDGVDHQYWDVPERQDAQAHSKGGPDRVVATGAGGNTAGVYAATLSLFAYGWELFDKAYADSLQAAAIDIYDKIVYPKRLVNTTGFNGFYNGGNSQYDDFPAMAALALFITTKDHRFYYDLVENKAINDNPNAKWSLPYFAAGYLGSQSGFYPGGWPTDYENIHSYVIYTLAKMVLPTDAKAAEYGINAVVRDSLLKRSVATLRRMSNDGSNGTTAIPTKDGYFIHADEPYHGVYTSVGWGFNRYNMGSVNELFMMWDLTGETNYLDIGLDNFNYNMGQNPWDVSFIMGTGDKNLQHPHNRAANPDGYNAGGFPYEYHCPRGALMGGSHPSKVLKDDWKDYTVTETCIDFSAQIVLPAQMLAKDLPPDNAGPVFSNVVATPITATSAIISWQTDELAQVTIFVSKTAGGAIIDTLYSTGLSKSGSVQADGLTAGATYFFYLQGQDIRHNMSTDDNHGEWYSFVMTANPAVIANVRICQVDDQSAKIYWWTTNGAYPTTLKYGLSATALTQSYTGDAGTPVLFHEALLTGLTPSSTYHFQIPPSTTDYQFTTTANAVYLNYTITTKPDKKGSGNAHFYIEIINNESKPYKGLELRWYFNTVTAGLASSVVVHPDDIGRFDAAGSQSNLNVTAGAPVQVAGTNQWYIPFTIQDTIVVAGRARIGFQVNKKENYSDYGVLPFSELVGSWSLVPHVATTDPTYFTGVDLAKGTVYTGPDQIETVNGVPEITYVRDPYISAYYNGVHIFGYPPDYANGNTPISKRSMYMTFSAPFLSPQVYAEQDSFSANFAGSAWTTPTGNMNKLEYNSLDLSSAIIYPNVNRKDTFLFANSVGNLLYGSNREEYVAWHNSEANTTGSYDCACAYKRLMIDVDTNTVPKVKRLLQFDPADTVSFYTGKRKLVKVTLTDSLGAPITDEDITFNLGALENGFQFYADMSSPVAITSVDLVAGVAQFYVGYDIAITSRVVTSLNLVAANPKADFLYIVKNPVLVAEPPPPWPIISGARMVDTNCDQIPDAIDITLTGSFEAGKYEFGQVSFEFEGDTLTTVDTSDVTTNGFRVHFVSPSGNVNTSSQGMINMTVKVVGQGTQVSEDAYKDGVGPAVLSVSILEKTDFSATAKDTLYVQFSEPVSAGTSWMFNVYNAAGVAVADTPAVVGAKIVDDAKNIWMYVLDSVSGKQPIAEGMIVQLKSGADLMDRNGNGASACVYAKLRVTLKRLPVPMEYAVISDPNKDGVASLVQVTFKRAVDLLHEPDSMQVIFGFAAPETLTVKQWIWSTDRLTATLTLTTPFSQGATAGNYTGIYQGKQLLNGGLVIQQKGAGADYEESNVVAEDKTTPIILSATFGSGTLIDTLKVTFSEPLASLADTAGRVQILRERGGSIALDPFFWRLSSDGTSAIFFYTETAAGYVGEGDRIRLDPVVSWFSDFSGNAPGTNNPWVSVIGSSDVKIKVDIAMRDGVTKNSTRTGSYGSNPPSALEQFRMTLLNPTKGSLDIWNNGIRTVSGIDTLTYKPQGPSVDLTFDIPRGSGYGEAPVWDSVTVHMDLLIYSNQGAYVNSVSQKFTLTNGNYLDLNNKVAVRIEWTSQDGKGPVSKNGRSVGNGAFVAKAVVTSAIVCRNKNVPVLTRVRFDNKKFTHTENWLFGYMRPVKK